jgi:hypothetical protein
MTILLTKYLIAVAIIALVMAIAAVGKRALSDRSGVDSRRAFGLNRRRGTSTPQDFTMPM